MKFSGQGYPVLKKTLTNPMNAGVGFVESLSLEELGTTQLWRPRSGSAQLVSERGGASAYVVAASVVTFADAVFGQQKEDLLNSTLLAQLAANRAADREKDTQTWYEAYRTVLYGVFWRREGGLPGKIKLPSGGVLNAAPLPRRSFVPTERSPLTFNRVPSSLGRFTIPDIVQSAVRAADGERMASVVETNLARFGQLSDRDRRVIIFESSSRGAGRGNFQIVAASSDENHVLRMTIVAMFFSSNTIVSRVLSFPFGRTVPVYQARDQLALRSEDYDPVRQSVVEQLGDQASAYIAEL